MRSLQLKVSTQVHFQVKKKNKAIRHFSFTKYRSLTYIDLCRIDVGLINFSEELLSLNFWYCQVRIFRAMSA